MRIFTLTEFLILLISFGPPLFGVLFGFELNRYNEKLQFQNRVDQILPYVEIELRKNIKALDRAPVQITQGDFAIDYWEMYKNELAKWQEINVVPLTEIYSIIKKMEKPSALQIKYLEDLISYQLNVYKNWYSDKLKGKAGKKGRKEKRNVIGVYKKLPIPSSTVLIINEMEKELNELEKLLNC